MHLQKFKTFSHDSLFLDFLLLNQIIYLACTSYEQVRTVFSIICLNTRFSNILSCTAHLHQTCSRIQFETVGTMFITRITGGTLYCTNAPFYTSCFLHGMAGDNRSHCHCQKHKAKIIRYNLQSIVDWASLFRQVLFTCIRKHNSRTNIQIITSFKLALGAKI